MLGCGLLAAGWETLQILAQLECEDLETWKQALPERLSALPRMSIDPSR